MIIHTGAGIENAIREVNDLLTGETRPDAVLCGSDIIALGAVRAARRIGLGIPDDFGVLSFDNTAITALAEPGITSMDVDTYELGVQTAEILINQIENPEASIRHVLLSTRVVERESTRRHLE